MPTIFFVFQFSFLLEKFYLFAMLQIFKRILKIKVQFISIYSHNLYFWGTYIIKKSLKRLILLMNNYENNITMKLINIILNLTD